MINFEELPVAIVGAGPIGLAAAAHLSERGIPVKVYEAGLTVGANIRDWAHVRIFTTWEQSIDAASQRLLDKNDWQMPRANHLPTGGELYEQYLQPLAETPELKSGIETSAKVLAITRLGTDKINSKDRETKPFRLTIDTNGLRRYDLARAVIDASGTWQNPNPLGASGLPAIDEAKHSDHLAYGMPDVLGQQRPAYAGRRIAVVGAGYSAANVLLDLAQLAESEPATSVVWVVRGSNLARVYGGGKDDQLPARGALGWHLKQLVDLGKIELISGIAIEAVHTVPSGIILEGQTISGAQQIGPLSKVVVATGQRPDLEMTRELRLELDPWLESVKALGPLIDPNLHSCGSVPPHGHREVSHPEPGFYTIGIKSYGRAPTFLLLTGYEQARSVAAAIAGDRKAADDVHLVLPETGICQDNIRESEVSCCEASRETTSRAKAAITCCRVSA